MSRSTQSVSLINQQVNPLSSFQNLLNVLAHDIPDVVDLGLDVLESVILASFCGSVFNHQFLEVCIEACSTVGGERGEFGILVLAQEALLDFDEEAEGDATSKVLFSDDEVGETRSISSRSGSGVGDVVDVVCAVGVGQLLGGRVINLWENQRGQ